jgi:hypothetical protein
MVVAKVHLDEEQFILSSPAHPVSAVAISVKGREIESNFIIFRLDAFEW